MTLLAFLMAVGRYPYSSPVRFGVGEWIGLVGFYGVMLWLACSELAAWG